MRLSKKKTTLIQVGFSLIELLVVVSIIGILAGLGIFAYDSYVEYSRRAVNEANAKLLANLLTAELTAQRGKLKSYCQQTMSRGPSATDPTWSACFENLININKMINPYTNKIYGTSPVDPQGFGTWIFAGMWGTISDNFYNPDESNLDYMICGPCSDDAGGIVAIYTTSWDDWNLTFERFDKVKGYIATCSVLKFDEQDPWSWYPIARKFFAIQE